MPKNTPTRIIDSQKTRAASFLGGSGNAGGVTDHGTLGGLLDNDHPQYVLTTTAIGAGDGLTGGGAIGTTGTSLAVGAGNMITVAADTVAIADGGAYQFIGTGAGAAASWRTVSELAGNGLMSATGFLAVGVSGLGLSVGADAVTLTSSSNPGAAASILASDSAGALALTKVRTPLIDTASGNLVLQPASSVVALPSAVAVQTDNYASQLTGWRATYAGEADFRYLFVDEMHAKSFIADLEQALAGGQIICKSVAMVASAFTVPAASGTATLRVRDLPSAANMAVFVSGDIVRLRTFSRSGGSLTIADAWGVVTSYADGTGGNEGTQTWTFTRSAAPNAGTMATSTVIQPDAIVLDYGTTGNGYYEVNAIDGAYGLNSPYARIATWTTHPATGTALRAQFGNLRGVYGYSGTEFGVAMGSATGANVTVDATNGVRLRQGTTDTIVLAPDGTSYFAGVMTLGASGEIRQGTGTLGSNYTGLRVWRDTNVGRIGGYNGDTLQWAGGTDGVLYAGSGNVALWNSGLAAVREVGSLAGTRIAFYTASDRATRTGFIGSYTDSSAILPYYNSNVLWLQADTSTGKASPLILLNNDTSVMGTLSLYGQLATALPVRQHTTSNLWSIDAAGGTTLSLANTFVYQFSSTSVFTGMVLISNAAGGATALFVMGGGQVVKVADGSSAFSTTKDTSSKLNLYYDGASTEYRLQNNSGSTATLSIFSVRARAAS